MRTQPTSTGGKQLPTDTPNVFRRDARYVVKWHEDGKPHRRSFPTYEAACAFKRDYVDPHREHRGLPPTAIAPGKRGSGWVYVFQSQGPDEQVKIGWSSDPAKRLQTLSAAQAHDLDLMLLIPGGQAAERRIHAALKHLRLRGEWYSREALSAVTAMLWSGAAED